MTGIGGAGRSTKEVIKRIQGHFGGAVRSNDSVEAMQKSIWDIFRHRNRNHSQCPTWCPNHRGDMDRANKHQLPQFVCDIIKPVFDCLTSRELLEKCVHRGTQNANEAFHHVIWERVPKEKFCGAKRLKLGVSVATVGFNDGEKGIAAVFADAPPPLEVCCRC